jgi:hypothetical protein
MNIVVRGISIRTKSHRTSTKFPINYHPQLYILRRPQPDLSSPLPPLIHYPRHNLHPTQDLGTLRQLPVELQHLILGNADFESLLTFRRTNRLALQTVDSLHALTKSIKFAPNTIHMALAIKTAHTFSIAQLFAKLCQTHCDAHTCANLAPYIDVFTMTRRCFGVGSPCARVPPPASQYHIIEYLSHLPSPLPGPLVGHFSACQLPRRTRHIWRRCAVGFLRRSARHVLRC